LDILKQLAESPGEEDQPVWVKVFPVGTFKRAAGKSPWVLTPETLQEMADNFHAGVLGRDVGFNCKHNFEGASPGWFKDVEARQDGLYVLPDWTSYGAGLLSDKLFRYTSPEWFWEWERPSDGQVFHNVLTGCALTNDPFFPGLPAVAEMSEVQQGGPIIMQMDEARTQYEAIFGPQSDEAWGAIAAAAEAAAEGEMDWEAWLGGLEPPAAAAETTLPPSPPVAPAVEDAVAPVPATAEAEIDRRLMMAESRNRELEARLAEETADRDRQIAELRANAESRDRQVAEAAVTELVQGSMPPGWAPTPVAREVFLRSILNPTRETAEAVLDHLKANGGKVGMYAQGEAPQVDAAHVANPLDALTSGTRAKVESIMAADGLDAAAALHKHNTRPVGGLS
jgi:hypothetical protein